MSLDSYTDRVNKFNDMVNTTADHVRAIQEATTKFKESNDPVGLGLNLTSTLAGSTTGIAGAIGGVQHFKDLKKMYGGIKSQLSNVRDRVNNPQATNSNTTRGGDSNNEDPVSNSGANASDENAPQVNKSASTSAQENIDNGINDRIQSLNENPFTTQEANDINKAINQKVSSTLGSDGKTQLNNAVRSAGRGADSDTISAMAEGDEKVAAQQEFLNFKNNVANDSIQRYSNGQPQASGYDRNGNPLDDGTTPSNTVNDTPSNNVNPVQSDNNVNLAPNTNEASVSTNPAGDTVNVATSSDENASGIVAQGRAALSNLMGGQNVPSRLGGQVQGLRVMGDSPSQSANMGAKLQQEAGDQVQNQTSALRNPNGIEMQDMASTQPSDVLEGTKAGGLNPFQGSSAGAQASDDITSAVANAGSKVSSGLSTAAETGLDIASGVGDAIDTAAGFSGPLAPIVGLVGSLVTLGTSIASAFHKPPPQQKQAPPPPTQMNIGGNLRDTLSGGGYGIA